jgi:tripartite-type tricarboxylate transporter receptor subunit TctC
MRADQELQETSMHSFRTSIALRTLAKVAVTVLVAGAALTAAAQSKPVIRILVGYPAGSGADAAARIYAEYLGNMLQTTAVVENKPGAGGLLAVQALKQASAESNSVMLTLDHQVVMLPLITRNPGFDVRKDLVPVARLLTFNTCLAVPAASPVQNLSQYIAQVKASATNGNYGVPAPGSQAQFVGYVIGRHFNVPMTPVPYRGAAPAIVDLIGNQVPAIVVPCDGLTEYRKAGKIRIIAAAADNRLPIMPEVPTFAELGVKMPTDNFVAVYASPSLKPELLKQVTEATRQMLQSPRAVERLNATGMVATYATPDELVHIWDKSSIFWAEQVRASNFQAE